MEIENNKNKDINQLPDMHGRYIVVDTETTGLTDKDHILELAAIEIENGKITGNNFHLFIQPRTRINPKAAEIHKMDESFFNQKFKVNNYLSTDKALQRFLHFCGDSLLFAHNALFDYKFITKELLYWGLEGIPLSRYRCSMRIFQDIFGKLDSSLKKKSNLKKCCEYFSLPASDTELHSAMYDTLKCAELVCCMMNYRSNNQDEENYNINSNPLAEKPVMLVNMPNNRENVSQSNFHKEEEAKKNNQTLEKRNVVIKENKAKKNQITENSDFHIGSEDMKDIEMLLDKSIESSIINPIKLVNINAVVNEMEQSVRVEISNFNNTNFPKNINSKENKADNKTSLMNENYKALMKQYLASSDKELVKFPVQVHKSVKISKDYVLKAEDTESILFD